ncbi:MAG TPA: caspase family protein [Pyrinomonadaceae bacterium]|nr:caspase family protein [Pyrinomonadaceae bacterium]
MSGLENAYALVAGIANYQNINPLPQTVLKDARDLYDLLIDPNYCGYLDQNVNLMLDDKATGAAFRAGLAELAERANEDSTVFFYLSSHGGRIDSGPFSGEYLLPVDTVYTSDESLSQSAISGPEFSAALRKIRARKLVAVLDCCHSGGIGQPKDAVAPTLKIGLPESYYDLLKAGRGRVIIASSRDTEFSWVLPGASNSLFTQHLLAALRGGAVGSGGLIRVFDTFDYLQPRVTADQPAQHPLFKAELEQNFPIASYQGGKAPVTPSIAETDDEFSYDVFISYRHREPDKTWVRKTLLPRLKAEGLRVCIDFECFALSAFLIKEMERAVEQSRYTVSVLTPAYLEGGFAEFEEILAEHLGLEKRQRRYLGIMREPCSPSLRIRARFWLNMTNSEEFEEGLPRLIHQLRQSPTA